MENFVFNSGKWQLRFTKCDSEKVGTLLKTMLVHVGQRHQVELVRGKIMLDRRLTVREHSGEFAISLGFAQIILIENLGMTRIAANFV